MTFSPTDRARAAHLGPERRRPQVLDAALSIAATEGIAAVSVARVAERLGVTRPVVYACFADRVDLIRALVGRFLFEGTPDPAVRELFGRGRMLIGTEFERLIRPTLEAWGTTDVRRKLPVLVELFLSSCEGAVRTLLADGSAWTPEELGEFVGRAVYRALREA